MFKEKVNARTDGLKTGHDISSPVELKRKKEVDSVDLESEHFGLKIFFTT